MRKKKKNRRSLRDTQRTPIKINEIYSLSLSNAANVLTNAVSPNPLFRAFRQRERKQGSKKRSSTIDLRTILIDSSENERNKTDIRLIGHLAIKL